MSGQRCVCGHARGTHRNRLTSRLVNQRGTGMTRTCSCRGRHCTCSIYEEFDPTEPVERDWADIPYWGWPVQ